MSLRLTKIDDLSRGDHYYLDAADGCYYLGEYTARQGYAFSEINNLILNLKKKPNVRGTAQWRYKEQAIRKAGEFLRNVLSTGRNEQWLQQATLIPVPPSKICTDPLYDDRMLRVLRVIGEGRQLDIRELVRQRENAPAAHESCVRPRPEDLIANYELDPTVIAPRPVTIGLFDDLLTTGCHFKAASAVLQAQYPGVPVIGIFIARRVPQAVDLDAFDL